MRVWSPVLICTKVSLNLTYEIFFERSLGGQLDVNYGGRYVYGLTTRSLDALNYTNLNNASPKDAVSLVGGFISSCGSADRECSSAGARFPSGHVLEMTT